MPSFSTPLSGLNANSQELSVIANNLANLNTVGYKDQVTNFQDLFYQQIGTNGAGNPAEGVKSVSQMLSEKKYARTCAPSEAPCRNVASVAVAMVAPVSP